MKKLMTSVAALALAACAFTGYYKQENQEGLKNIIKAFEKANPGISVTPLIIPNDADATMSARAAQGDLPDIIQMQGYSRIKEYASKGYLIDLTDKACMKNVLPSALPAVTYNDKSFAMPMDFAGIGIIYNKDIFAKCGLEAPQTYRDLEKVCRTLSSNGYVPFAGLLKEPWSIGHFFTLVQTALISEKGITPDEFIAKMNEGNASYGDVDTAKLFSILDFYKENLNPNAAEMDGGAQQQSFAKGESAMMVQGLWAYVDALKLNPNLNAGFIPFPVFNEAAKNKMYADVDSTFGLSSQSTPEEQAAALKFLDFLASNEGSKLWISEYKLTNSFKGADFSPLGSPFNDLMKSVAERGANPWAFSQYPSDVWENACKVGPQQYMMTKKTASDVIRTIDASWAASTTK